MSRATPSGTLQSVRAWWSQKVASARRVVVRAIEESSSPRQLAASIALGALTGSSPLLGLHTVVALGGASLLRLNRLAAFVGTNVSFGPMMPLIAWAEYTVGSKLLGVSPPVSTDPLAAARGSLFAWWLGFAIVGPLIACVAGGTAWALARARMAHRARAADS